MGKLYDSLQRQLKTEDKHDAEKCLKLYNYLKDTTGSVWESNWNPLTTVRFEGIYPNSTRIYKPSSIGETLLKGINETEKT
jgi:hypothetical protein